MALYGVLTVLIAFYLIDTLVAATLLTVTAPFWLAAPAFPGGGKYFMQALRMALHAMLTVAFVAIAGVAGCGADRVSAVGSVDRQRHLRKFSRICSTRLRGATRR